jgi:hypothetical protein
MAVPYTFGTATAAIPLSQLDSNFATAITLGNTAVYLGNTTTSIGNLTLTNVTISSGSVTITDVTASGNVTLSGGTANGVAYLNGSKVLTTGSALTFDGTNAVLLGSGGTGTNTAKITLSGSNANNYGAQIVGQRNGSNTWIFGDTSSILGGATTGLTSYVYGDNPFIWYNGGVSTELMRLTSSGLLVGLSSALANGKLQVAGSIGLSGNTQIRQASNSDGNTLQVFATQFVAGTSNSTSYGYAGNGLVASVSDSDGALLLDAGRATSTAGRFKVANTTSVDTAMSLEKNGVYSLYINTASGNLGLGVTPSAWGSSTAVEFLSGSLFSTSNGNSLRLVTNAYFTGSGYNYVQSKAAALYSQASGQHIWYNAPSGTAGNAITFTNTMILDASGNLGLGTSSPSASAILDAQSTTKGVRMPNMTTTQKNAISSPAAGLMVFDTTLSKLCVYSGAAWQTITSV